MRKPSRFPLTEAQKAALALGRVKGTNHLDGIPKSEESKRKRSETMKRWAKENPDVVAARGKKISGEKNYRWNGGCSRLNMAIRRLTEHRKWMDGVRDRDGKCRQCGRADCLESHHIVPLADLIASNGITTREQARECAALWDLSNGIALCVPCHYSLHGRHHAG